MWWRWSLRTKAACLAVIFLIVPLFLYIQFRTEHENGQALLLRNVRAQGLIMSRVLQPALQTADISTLSELGNHLRNFAGTVTTIKLLLAPVESHNDSFYYVASWPPVEDIDLQAERELLVQQGVLERLKHSCRGEIPFSLIYHRPTGGEEVVTAVTSVSTAAGCWAMVTSFSGDAFPGMHLGEPYWATPAVQIAAAVYVVLVVITFSTLFGLNAGLHSFARRARLIRQRGPASAVFASGRELPELAEVGAEFDRLVAALHRSAENIRRAAEDNAHAFKGPIAVIRQATEPLEHGIAAENQRARRALAIIGSSLDRLDGLVASARRLDEATADLMAEPRIPIDLESLIRKSIRGYLLAPSVRGVSIRADLTPGIYILATEELIETVIENLTENAISFSPTGGEVLLTLRRENDMAHLTVADEGPGIPATDLEYIFDRYYSERCTEDAFTPGTYFGIGLSIVRRNVEALGGAILAENRTPHGLSVQIRVPIAPRSATPLVASRRGRK